MDSLLGLVFGATGALAQNCVAPTGITTVPGAPGLLVNLNSFDGLATAPAGITSMMGSAVTAADTAFLLQNEAFVGAPANPGPNQQGGGVWVRGVGGQVDLKSTTASIGTASGTPPGAAAPVTAPGMSNCSQKVDSSFAGVQFGQDISKLNVNGWNVHLGTTAGYIGTRGNLVGGAFSFTDVPPGLGIPGGSVVGGGPFTSTTNVPFFGAYFTATHGDFYVDALIREEYFQTSLNAPGANLFGQALDAHGWAFAGSVGYNWKVPNSNWFVEPSAGLSISRVDVDPVNVLTSGVVGFSAFSGTVQMNQIKSDIGRVGLRVGETISAGNIVWQPFAAVSVWHEFGPNITSNANTCAGCVFLGTNLGPAVPLTITGTTSTSTFGTYGQYSLGVAGALAGTGWLGFARVDYRDGSELQGLSGTGGVRYQFSPEPVRGVMPTKAPLYKAPVLTAVNWTGFYIGGFGGAQLGRADWGYTGGEVSPHIGGFLGGGDIGYNYQTGSWVLGVEGDLSGTNTKGGMSCAPLIVGSPMFQMTCNASASWIGTATARVGYAWDRALLYVKGGGAWTDEKFSATCNFGGLNVPGQNCTNPAGALSKGFSASSDRGGWTIGYGSEFALTPNWSAKAETDYISFGDSNVAASDGSPLKIGMHLWEAKVGLNYHFGSSAISMRY